MKMKPSPFRALRSLQLVILVLLAAASLRLATTGAAATASPSAAQAAVTVTIDPVKTTMLTGTVKQFNAKINGVASTAVTWSITPPSGVNANAIGAISATGKYTAPASALPGLAPITVTATSTAAPGVFATGTVTVVNQIPVLSSVAPNQLALGAPFTLTVMGSQFLNGAQVLWNGVALQTQFNSSGQLTATGVASQLGSFNISIANPGGGTTSASKPVTVISLVAVNVAPANPAILVGGTQQFMATVTGSPNQAVTWQVNGIAGGDPSQGLISATGLYTAPGSVPPTGYVTISAVSQANGITKASTTITVKDPMAITNGRFLDQTTFGATSLLMAHVSQIGMQPFLDEQFNTPESTFPALATATRSTAVDAFFGNQFKGQDQLRQRMIYALSEINVIAMNKNTNGDELIPWLQLLSRNAFGNYHTLLHELTLDASMGKYLDLANSGVGPGAPNENYPREIMQLMSIGLYQLNQDGSQQLDGMGNPIPTYTQFDVQQMAKALTGWTYSNASATTNSGGNGSYYPGPMIPVPGAHNTTAKTILGQPLPAGQNAQQDLDGALNIVFNHPNVGPFMATRLIRAFVTSNPSPAYISRIAAVFNNNGSGVRGDLKAVINAIIMDPEARNDTPPANFGRLRTPTQHMIAFARAFNINLGSASQFGYLFYGMDEGILDAPSVFGHYSPTFRIPKSGGLFGPEFQIYSPSDAVNRANFIYSLIYNPWPINPVLQPYVAIANNPTALVNAVDNALLFGRMSQQTRTAITQALPAMYDNNQQVMTVLYFTATSGEFLVQR